MANRVLRDWTTSEAVELLSPEAEVFFTRLIMKADDYGSFYANPKLLKAALFPLKEYSDTMIKRFISECVEAELLFVYTVDEKEYVRIINFGQRLRSMRNIFPHPADKSPQPAASRRESPPETKRNEVETETESETETEPLDVACDLKELDDELVKLAADLTEGICEYFDVKPVVTSKLYNNVCDFVSTLGHRNELKICSLALQKYMTYKARSQEQKHSVLTWMGTRADFYRDGQWTMTNWEAKNKKYDERIKKISGPSSTDPQPGKDYHAERL